MILPLIMNFAISTAHAVEHDAYELKKTMKIPELNAVATLYEHKKTKAQIFYVDDQDDERTFSIAFRTPVSDDTGVPHILEHSVLCGSEKFPTKEPFVELAKGSVNTFLNAMTYNDRTIYPVASKNILDFKNLMHVYLDAVFFPKMRTDPFVLKQEGWHYEYDEKKKELTANGVVTNEMKGVFSSPESVANLYLYRELYPGITYGMESGGFPESIINLTQEQFVGFHEKYYHPSNSYIMLSGKLDVAEQLDFIDKEYLSKFDRKKINIEIPEPAPFEKVKVIKREYAVPSGESLEGKTQFYFAAKLGSIEEKEDLFAMEILKAILVDFPASPLRKALIDSKIVASISAAIDDSLIYPNIVFTAVGGNERDQESFRQIIEKTLKEVSEKGLDQNLVEAAISQVEFTLRELDFKGTPRGLVYNYMNLTNWLHEKDPFKGLLFAETLKGIKEKSNKGLFEDLIKKKFIQSKDLIYLTLVPKPGLEEENNEKFKKTLADRLAAMNKDELAKVITETKELKERQRTEDSKEALATIPLLKLSDLEKKAEELPLEIERSGNYEVMLSALPTNGIVYGSLYFDASAIPRDDIRYLSLFAKILKRVSTKHFHYEDLTNEIYRQTGGISVGVSVTNKNFKVEDYRPYLVIEGKALDDKGEKLFEMFNEILLFSQFSDKKRMKELVSEMKSDIENSISSRAFSMARVRSASILGGSYAYQERLDGLEFYRFLQDLDKNFDKKFSALSKKLTSISQRIFVQRNAKVGLGSEQSFFTTARPIISKTLSVYPEGKMEKRAPQLKPRKKNEAVIIGGKVQYVVKTANLYDFVKEYSGSFDVMKNFLGMGYLWNQVRVLGGAYGGMFRTAPLGIMEFASYRDPKLEETLEVYDKTSSYLSTLELDQRELNKMIIGTIGNLDSPLTPSMKASQAQSEYLFGITQEFKQKRRDQVFATTTEDLKKMSTVFAKMSKLKNYVVFGSEKSIKKSKKLFSRVQKF